MTQEELKVMVANKALEYIPHHGVIGVGSGTTVMKMIDAMHKSGIKVQKVLSSSNRTTALLHQIGIEVAEPDSYSSIQVYIDGADEVSPNLELIKGGGACLTREKILASMAQKFVCIVDQSKLVRKLGKFPLPVEIIPIARQKVTSVIEGEFGGKAVLREGCITDNQCQILDVHDLDISDPLDMESRINQIPGVVTVGLFAHRRADLVLYSTDQGVKILDPKN